jgi:hypothetical protein
MSTTCIKLALALALLVCALVGPAGAAANWTTNGNSTGVTFGGTGGPGILTVATTGAAPQGLSCAGGSGGGKLLGPSSGSGTALATGFFVSLNTCKVVGQNAAVRCDTTNGVLNVTTYDPVTNITTGIGSNVTCFATKAGCGNSTTVTGGITGTGTLGGTYGNTSQQLTVPTTGQNLSVTWSGAGCLAGTSPGSGKLTNTSGTASVYGLTTAFKPQITN